MKLESFRHDLIGIPYFTLSSTGDDLSQSVHATYIDYSLRAFNLTMQDIQELEYSKGDLIPDGRNSIVAATLWFLAFESYVNTLLKLTCLLLGLDFKIYKSKKVTEKFSSLMELLKIDSVEVKKTGIYSRINEFTIFRNEIFHDRNTGDTVQFKKTLFSSIPIQCNLVDVLQGLLIFLEIATLMRFSILGLDTMPDIFIHAKNKAFSKKLDILYLELIKPSVQQVLIKHQMVTNLNLDFQMPTPLTSDVFLQNKARAFIMADSPDFYKFQLNQEETNISYSLFSQIVDEEIIESTKFRLGKYSI